MSPQDAALKFSAQTKTPPAGKPALKRHVAVLPGDGIGPEVTHAAVRVLQAACPGLRFEEAEAGAAVFAKGIKSGLPADTLDLVERSGLVFKGPLATPVGYGEKSANVTLRKMFEMFGNVRPVKALPNVRSHFQNVPIDFVIVRENVEDLYAGVEHMQTPDVAQCLKLITRPGSAKISRLAFNLARAEGRGSVHCATKANIMKLTEGLFKSVFETVAQDYPDITAHHLLIDNCAHQMVRAPEQFDVIVTTNMNGDILSDLGAGLVGGLGLAPSANIGTDVQMFEAVHGSAPDIAGRGRANPTAMIRAGVMVLRHIGEWRAAAQIEHALAETYRDGTALTDDVAKRGQGVETARFVDALLANLDHAPVPAYQDGTGQLELAPPPARISASQSRLVRHDGADVFVQWNGGPEALASMVRTLIAETHFSLSMISNRGTMMYPGKPPKADTVDHWRCRFIYDGMPGGFDGALGQLLSRLSDALRWMHVEKLISLDGVPAYSKAQGEG